MAVVGGDLEHHVRVVTHELPELRTNTVLAARRGHRSRIRPTGAAAAPTICVNTSRMSDSAGRSCAINCSPASVGDTLRVVRASSRTPICSSSRRIAWLSPEVETFSRFAARVKLRSSATARNAERTLSSSRTIVQSQSTALADSTGYSAASRGATLILEGKRWISAASDEHWTLLSRRALSSQSDMRSHVMQATVLYGARDVRFEERPDPTISSRRTPSSGCRPPASAGPTCGRIAAFNRSPRRPRWATSTAASSRRSAAASRRSSPASS